MPGHVRPRRGVELALADAVELLAVHVPAQLVGADAAVPFEAVGVHRRLAGRPRAGAVGADPVGLVARPARVGAAVQDAPDRVEPVDVLHDVELADRRPVLVVPPVRGSQGPERRPVAEGLVAGDVGHLDASLDAQDAAVGGLEVGALGLDPGRRPLPRGGLDRGDPQVAAAVQAEVGGVGGVPLDLAGAPVAGAARVAVAGIDDPVRGRGGRAGRTVEVVAPDQAPAVRRRWDGRAGRR